jgi:hypothetical protein
VEADVGHAHLLLRVAERHAKTPEDRRAILRGARECLIVDRVYRGHLADEMAALS